MAVTRKEAQKPTEDVEMKNVDSPAAVAEPAEKPAVPVDPDQSTFDDLKENFKLIEKYVATKEPRFVLRVLRSLLSVRKRLNARVLRKSLSGFHPNNSASKDALLAWIDEPMDVEVEGAVNFKPRTGKAAQQPLLIEYDTYLHLLVVLYLLDLNRIDNVS